ncbi:putative zinc-finger-containing protein [Mycena rebaudengoi]|nr:putative zinc-finger-containing protein [Mycena rebaudengoi]
MSSWRPIQRETYCAACDKYFPSEAARAEHIQSSPAHPRCAHCDRRFLNKNILRNHYVYSRHHNYCASCEIEFKTPAGLRYHIETAAIHCDDSDSDSEDVEPARRSGAWEDEMGLRRYPDEEAPRDDDDDDDGAWEAFDDYDFEDAAELVDPEPLIDEEEEQEEGEEEDSVGAPVRQFACPVCEGGAGAVCCAPCGHMFCAPCITRALKQTEACPICREPGEATELRRIFLA